MRSPKRVDSQDGAVSPSASALALLIAAEKQVAVHGFSGASLRQIVKAAGARNESAIQYHFGSRDALFVAIFEYRMGIVNVRRRELLDQIERERRVDDRRVLIEVLVRPLAEQLIPRAEGNHYLRFLEQAARQHDPKGVPTEQWTASPAWQQADALVRGTIRHLPAALVDYRMQMITNQIISGLATIEAWQAHGVSKATALPFQIEALIDAIEAIAGARASPDTLRESRELQDRSTGD